MNIDDDPWSDLPITGSVCHIETEGLPPEEMTGVPATAEQPAEESNMGKEQNGSVTAEQRQLTPEAKREIAEWSVGKTEKEIKVKAATLGVSSATIYTWRRALPGVSTSKPASTPAERVRLLAELDASGQTTAEWAKSRGFPRSTVQSWLNTRQKPAKVAGDFRKRPRRSFTPEERRAVVASWEKATDRHAWARTSGYSESMVRRWRTDLAGKPYPSRVTGKKKLGRQPATAYTVEQKRDIVAYASKHTRRAASDRFGVGMGTITKWAVEEADGNLRDTKRGPSFPGQREAADATDEDLLAADHTERTAKRESRDELKSLRQELLVLRANLALARAQGYMQWMDIETMFKGGK